MSMLCALRAFVPVATSFGWVWGAWRDEPLAEETLSITELPRVLRSYASTVATLIRGEAAGDRFNVTAFGVKSGAVYGRDHWFWDTPQGRYTAYGEPWVPRDAEVTQDIDLSALTISRLPSRTVSAHGPRLAA